MSLGKEYENTTNSNCQNDKEQAKKESSQMQIYRLAQKYEIIYEPKLNARISVSGKNQEITKVGFKVAIHLKTDLVRTCNYWNKKKVEKRNILFDDIIKVSTKRELEEEISYIIQASLFLHDKDDPNKACEFVESFEWKVYVE